MIKFFQLRFDVRAPDDTPMICNRRRFLYSPEDREEYLAVVCVKSRFWKCHFNKRRIRKMPECAWNHVAESPFELVEARRSVMSGRRAIREDVHREDGLTFWWREASSNEAECRGWAVSKYRSFGFQRTTAMAVRAAVPWRARSPYCWFRRVTCPGDGIPGFVGEYDFG